MLNMTDLCYYWGRNMTLSDIECLLAAWSIEWEGTITILRTTKIVTMTPEVSISNTCFELLDEFSKIIGVGVIYGPYKYKNPKHKSQYIWTLRGLTNVLTFLQSIKTFLVTKQEQAEYVIKFCESRLSHKGYNESYTEYEKQLAFSVTSLNKRGKIVE